MKRQIKISNIIVVGLAVIIAIAVILCYFIHFKGTSLSGSTADWGSFGNYIGIGLSSLSIALIFITFKEQRSFNMITIFEQHYNTLTSTLKDMAKKHKVILDNSYQLFFKHFEVPFYDLSQSEWEKTKNVCNYYFTSINNDAKHELKYVFRYLKYSIDYICREESISDEDKSCRVTELGCILPESLRILFLCWILSDKDAPLTYYYQNGFLMLGDNSSPLLEDIITFICTGKHPQYYASGGINANEIDFGDDFEESFFDTYNRLFNDKLANQ